MDEQEAKAIYMRPQIPMWARDGSDKKGTWHKVRYIWVWELGTWQQMRYRGVCNKQLHRWQSVDVQHRRPTGQVCEKCMAVEDGSKFAPIDDH